MNGLSARLISPEMGFESYTYILLLQLLRYCCLMDPDINLDMFHYSIVTSANLYLAVPEQNLRTLGFGTLDDRLIPSFSLSFALVDLRQCILH